MCSRRQTPSWRHRFSLFQTYLGHFSAFLFNIENTTCSITHHRLVLSSTGASNQLLNLHSNDFFFFRICWRLSFVRLWKKCCLRRFLLRMGGEKKPDSAPCFHNNSRSFQLGSPVALLFVSFWMFNKVQNIVHFWEKVNLISWTLSFTLVKVSKPSL